MKVTIYCGVPGSGKTTLRKERQPRAFVCSTDDFFYEEDEHTGLMKYNFQIERLGEAHADCLRRFVEFIRTLVPHVDVAVDNTNTSVAEVAPYAALALAYGCELEIVTVMCDPAIAAARNIHGVPVEAVHRMHEALVRREMAPWWPHTIVRQ